MIPEVKKFHAYLTEMCRNAEFGTAVSATNYAVEGVAQKISEKALRGLAKNAKIGPRGRWWLEEHAKYDDEHPIRSAQRNRLIARAFRERGSRPPLHLVAGNRPAELDDEAVVAVMLTDADADDV